LLPRPNSQAGLAGTPLFFFLFLSIVSGSHSSARGLFPFLLPVTVHAPRNEQRPAASLPAPHRAPARQMRAAWPWARTPMISAVHRTRPTLACPYKIGLILFLLSAVAAMGESPNPLRRRPQKRKEGSYSWTFASSSSRSWSHHRTSKTRRAEHQEHHAAHACIIAADDKVTASSSRPARTPPSHHGATASLLTVCKPMVSPQPSIFLTL
jgi:hypothetical protein